MFIQFENFSKARSTSPEEKEVFMMYFFNYYSQDYGFFGNTFPKNIKIDRELILKYVDFFIRRRKELRMWGRGDTFDREVFRDFLLVKLGIRKLDEVEYSNQVVDYLTDLERDIYKYNL